VLVPSLLPLHPKKPKRPNSRILIKVFINPLL
jgi:hypothetical protein